MGVAGGGQVLAGNGVQWPPHVPDPCSGSTLLTAGSRSALRRTATTPMPHFTGVTGAGPCSWHWTGGGPHDVVAGPGGTTYPPISCLSWSPEAPRGREEQLDKIPEDTWAGGQGPEVGGGLRCGQTISGHSFISQALSACCVQGTGDPAGTPQMQPGPHLSLRGVNTELSRGCVQS